MWFFPSGGVNVYNQVLYESTETLILKILSWWKWVGSEGEEISLVVVMDKRDYLESKLPQRSPFNLVW